MRCFGRSIFEAMTSVGWIVASRTPIEEAAADVLGYSPILVAPLIGTPLIVGALTFFPADALG
jgi:K+-transporting ATPase A subunit